MRTIDKSMAQSVIKQMPEEFTIEELVKELSHFAKIERGLRQVETGEVCSHEEAKKKLAKWLE